jgi:hypothetical protein
MTRHGVYGFREEGKDRRQLLNQEWNSHIRTNFLYGPSDSTSKSLWMFDIQPETAVILMEV